MKRLGHLILNDMIFQYKYGFYALYLFFSLLYVGFLHVLPESWRTTVSPLIIFSDPAMLGLIFIGAIVLFEKSERVVHSLAVSPIKITEYVLSKGISLALISTASAWLIASLSGFFPKNYAVFTLGIFLGSFLFTCIGLVCSTRIATLNQFILSISPLQLIFVIPVVVYQFWNSHPLWLLHPGNAVFELISEKTGQTALSALSLGCWITAMFLLAVKEVSQSIQTIGGGR